MFMASAWRTAAAARASKSKGWAASSADGGRAGRRRRRDAGRGRVVTPAGSPGVRRVVWEADDAGGRRSCARGACMRAEGGGGAAVACGGRDGARVDNRGRWRVTCVCATFVLCQTGARRRPPAHTNAKQERLVAAVDAKRRHHSPKKRIRCARPGALSRPLLLTCPSSTPSSPRTRTAWLRTQAHTHTSAPLFFSPQFAGSPLPLPTSTHDGVRPRVRGHV